MRDLRSVAVMTGMSGVGSGGGMVDGNHQKYQCPCKPKISSVSSRDAERGIPVLSGSPGVQK